MARAESTDLMLYAGLPFSPSVHVRRSHVLPLACSQSTVRRATRGTRLLHPVRSAQASLGPSRFRAYISPPRRSAGERTPRVARPRLSTPGGPSDATHHHVPLTRRSHGRYCCSLSSPTRPSIREDCTLPTRVSPPRRDCAGPVVVPPRALQPSPCLPATRSVNVVLGLALLNEPCTAVSVFHQGN